RRHHGIRPAFEALSILARYAKHPGDHDHRQWPCQFGHEVKLVAPVNSIEKLVHNLLDPRAHLLHAPRRERLAHEAPQTAMFRRVLREHRIYPTKELVGAFSSRARKSDTHRGPPPRRIAGRSEARLLLGSQTPASDRRPS